MLIEFSIIPLGGDPHISEEIAEAMKVLDTSGLPYQLTPSATCIEGDWDEVLPVVRLCHARVRAMSPHVMTFLKIEDDENEHDKLSKNVLSVEEKVGHPLKREEARPSSPVIPETELTDVKTHT
ncbi:MAG: MTH1187 family thiamine-binding protein [Candidatus Omnitrophica bacterium]|nr:MTH1187 family thiamine-binding protein [Candidatus Omnitrophota bacterium]